MDSFCDFGWVPACHIQAENHVKNVSRTDPVPTFDQQQFLDYKGMNFLPISELILFIVHLKIVLAFFLWFVFYTIFLFFVYLLFSFKFLHQNQNQTYTNQLGSLLSLSQVMLHIYLSLLERFRLGLIFILFCRYSKIRISYYSSFIIILKFE